MTDEELDEKWRRALEPVLASGVRRGLVVGVVCGVLIGFLLCMLVNRPKEPNRPDWLRSEWGVK